MPGHSNEELKKTIASSDELVKKMADLRKSMVADLNVGFKQTMGEDVPSMRHTKVREIDTIMQYTSEVKIDHFLKSVLDLGQAAFKGDEAEIVTKAMAVAGVALTNIFGSIGVSTEIKGESAILEHDDKEYLTAMYSVTQVCNAKRWFTDTDFVVSSYIYFITKPLAPEANSNAARLLNATALSGDAEHSKPFGSRLIRPTLVL